MIWTIRTYIVFKLTKIRVKLIILLLGKNEQNYLISYIEKEVDDSVRFTLWEKTRDYYNCKEDVKNYNQILKWLK